ncbi:endospore germination permease [Neobacillus cucumis]|uniref:GerAB/ArcD/ProY family transporter n=1 Tax=Neobacillus cucumis TaxID=1740721 RepID=UPI002E1F0B9A|nr:endospore germination permease [Neobacillus cucumis]MED4226952.1 endospore germination permease [Neobacillus cucumis]
MKISPKQLFWIIAILDIGMTLLLTQTPAIAAAKQDAWICFAIAGAVSVGLTFIAGKLSLLYPNQTFIEYCQTILGKWLGRIIVIPYFIQLIPTMGIILRESSDFIQMTLFRNTPLLVLILLMIYLMVYITYKGGIEGIARCSEFIGPVIFLVIIFTMLLSLSNIQWKQIFPIYADSGWRKIVEGSFAPVGFLGEANIIMMLLFFTKDPKKGVKITIGGIAMVSFIIMLNTLEVIMVFGSGLASRLWYPYFEMVRYISALEFLQNVEIFLTVIWMLSVFIKLSTFLFVTSHGIGQLFHLKDWRKVIWFIAIALIPLSTSLYPNIDVSSVGYPKRFFIPYVVPINMIVIPMLLLVVGTIRKNRKEKRGPLATSGSS